MKSIFQQDVDHLFSYNTKRQVQFRDRLLGILNYGIMLCIMSYVIGYVFIYDEGYLKSEASYGLIVTAVRGDVVADSQSGDGGKQYFSAEDIAYPGLENGNIFITTKIEIQKQHRGVCEDLTMQCRSTDDCSKDVDAECTSNRYCKEPSWCDDGPTQIYKLGSDQTQMWVKSSIQFSKQLASTDFPVFYSNEMDEPVLYPNPGFNTFAVRDLLQACDPPVQFEEVSELGAAIEVQFIWNCQVDHIAHHCEPKIQARRVDSAFDSSSIGFGFTHAEYGVGDQDPNVRTKMSRKGIRFYFRTTGLGRAVDPSEIIFKLSTGGALIGFAPIFADVIMLNCFKLKKKYYARKFEVTEDLGEYFEGAENAGDLSKQLQDELFSVQEEEDDEYDDEEHEWRRRFNEDED
jgi:hypothetical protein